MKQTVETKQYKVSVFLTETTETAELMRYSTHFAIRRTRPCGFVNVSVGSEKYIRGLWKQIKG